MSTNWQDNPATLSVLESARNLTTDRAGSLIWSASELVRAAISSIDAGAKQETTSILALAACQQALFICEAADEADAPTKPYAVSNESTLLALEAVANGANAIGGAGPAGVQRLVENVLPLIHQAVQEFSDEALVHEITVWFLLGLSVGPHDRGPEATVYEGLLLAYPMPEQQMRWSAS